MLPDSLRRFALPAGFFLLALLTAWSLASALPPGQAADEQAHAIRIDALSRGQFLGHREGDRGGVTASPTLLEVAAVTPFGHAQARAERDRADAMRWSKQGQFFDLGTVATYFPAVYAPAAIEVELARAFRAKPVDAFRAGRQVNLVTFCLLGAAALTVAQLGRALIAVILLLPMSLGLAASLSGDGILIGLSALAAACATRGDGRGWWAAAGLVTLAGLTKLPYAPLLLVLLTSGGTAFPVRLGVLALSAGVMLGWAAYNQAAVMGTVGWPLYEAGPLWPGAPRSFDRFDPHAQLQVLAADLTRAVTLPVQVFMQNPWIWRQMIGVLGWLSIEMPGWVYSMWTGVLALAALGLLVECGPGPAPALAGLLAIVLSAWAITLVQYLGWSQVGATSIDGVQGRYFLPLLPFLAASIPCVRPLRLPGLAAVPLAAGFVSAATVPVVVALASLSR